MPKSDWSKFNGRKSRVAILLGPCAQTREFAYARTLSTLLSKEAFKEALWVAVDGGYDAFFEIKKKGGERVQLPPYPQICVGDFDSVRRKIRDRTIKIYKSQQNESDLAFALQRLQDSFKPEVVFAVGFMGGRLDHHLAAVFELARFKMETPGIQVECHDPEGEHLFLMGPVFKRKVKLGASVSLFALAPRVEVSAFKGLRYFLPKGECFEFLHGSKGLSNVAEKSNIQFKIKKGLLLAVISRN